MTVVGLKGYLRYKIQLVKSMATNEKECIIYIFMDFFDTKGPQSPDGDLTRFMLKYTAALIGT
jgi:hypothetical protein